MGRPNLSDERRRELIGAVARTFAELGYRRTTTAVLAERCGVQETILYRLWPDKRAMFIATVEYVASHSEQVWARVLDAGGARSGAERLLEYEATHLGELGLYRILFAGFSETDDEEIAAALRAVYQRFLRFIGEQVDGHRARGKAGRGAELPSAELTAWAIVGLGTAMNLGRELGLLKGQKRRQLFESVGRHLLG